MKFPCRAFWCACGGRYAPSLHAWGIRAGLLLSLPARRFIPTCVGNTAGASPTTHAGPVHPHVRGEYTTSQKDKIRTHGSSPRAWGILSLGFRRRIDDRFIPTCVGNTAGGLRRRDGQAVHPHVRGEYVARAAQGGRRVRFIPTCVGNTCDDMGRVKNAAVHPHVRGEYGRLTSLS